MKRTLLRGLYAPELLESRIAPATFTVTTLADSGAGSLREAIEGIGGANATAGADTIVFAATLPLGTILLTTGEIDISDTLTIKGPGVDKLRLDGNDASRIFNIADLDDTVLHPTTISGLAFANGKTVDEGGAITTTESLILKNTAFTNNYAYLGGGGAVFVDTKGTISITGSTFLNNTTKKGDGGALYGKALGSITVAKTVVSGNHAENGDIGGILALIPAGGLKPAHIVIDAVTFLSNTADDGSGGGLIADTSSVKGKITVKNSVFIGNSASETGGAALIVGGLATVSGTTMSNNQANGEGGALLGLGSVAGTLAIKSSRFEGNSSGGNGGAIHFEGETLATVAGSFFSANKSADLGGAISALNTASLTISSSTITGNRAFTKSGGGIALEGSTLVLKGSVVSGNIADTSGGGIYAIAGSVLTVSGGSFKGNSANGAGGGIATEGTLLNAVNLTVTGTLFTGNASTGGGAVSTFGDGVVVIKSAKVQDNANVFGGGGGGMYLRSSSSITVSSSVFARNHAVASGGGLVLAGGGTTLVTGSSFLMNTAGTYGGGIAIFTSVAASILKSKVTGNVAGVAGGGIYGALVPLPVLTGTVPVGNFAITGPNIHLV